MMKILATTMIFAQMISTGNHRKIFTPSSGCSMPSSGALAEYYASATGGGAPSSCTGAAITSWGDNSGHAANLTAVGSPTCAAEAGILGKNAVNLTGAPYFTTASGIACETSCFFGMVVNMNSLTSGSTFFSSTINNNALALQVLPSGKQELDQQFVLAIGNSTTALTAGTWAEIGFKYTGGTVTFYLNGVADGTGSNAATISSPLELIGANYSSVPQAFANAKIAEMYFSTDTTVEAAFHSCSVSRFGI